MDYNCCIKQWFSAAKRLWLMLCACVALSSAQAQFVAIPDTAFVNILGYYGFGACLNGNQLDTTCPAVLNTHYLDISYQHLNSLEGIQYFKNLDSLKVNADTTLTYIPSFPPNIKVLECRNNGLDSLPALPVGLQRLSCEFNKLTTLPALPATLNYLACYNNKLDSLPPLPDNLVSLYCSGNRLTQLPALPNALKYLFCYGNQLTSLPALGGALVTLNCANNLLHTLPDLPATLISLDCYTNSLTTLPALPAGINYVGCHHNQLGSLPPLPGSLTSLNCSYNNLNSLPALPDSMYQLFCNNNPNLRCMPVFNTIYNLEFYSTGINCVPTYGNVYTSQPTLTAYPVCDATNNTYGCTVIVPTGVNDIALSSINIYPNPANGSINIEITCNAELNIYTLNAQLVQHQLLHSGNNQLQLSNASAGLYYAQIKSGNTVQTVKLVLQ